MNEDDLIGYEETGAEASSEVQEEQEGYSAEAYSEEESNGELQYYSYDDIENMSEDEDFDMDKIPPAMMKMFEKMQKVNDNTSVPQFNLDTELSLDQVSAIRQKAIDDVALYLSQKGEDYSDYEPAHQQLVQEYQKNLIKRVKQDEYNNKLSKAIDADLKGKYGKNFDAINKLAMKYFDEEISAAKNKELSQRIRNGDTKIVYKIYENAAKKFFGSNASPKRSVFPPHSISGVGSKPSKNKKVLKEDYFL